MYTVEFSLQNTLHFCHLPCRYSKNHSSCGYCEAQMLFTLHPTQLPMSSLRSSLQTFDRRQICLWALQRRGLRRTATRNLYLYGCVRKRRQFLQKRLKDFTSLVKYSRECSQLKGGLCCRNIGSRTRRSQSEYPYFVEHYYNVLRQRNRKYFPNAYDPGRNL